MSTVPVRDAATVVLLRDGAHGPQTWMLTRVRQMVFAAGMSVFPGGRVEPADAELPMTGTDLADLAQRFGTDERTARELVGTAVRETFEETGVLLTTDAPASDLTAARTDVENRRLAFADLLVQQGLTIDAGALRPWARWITPLGEVRRYDTRFFVAALPNHAVAADVTTESSHADWVSVVDALDAQRRGERTMLPPTVFTLTQIAAFGSVDEVLSASAQRSLEPVEPQLMTLGDGSTGIWVPDVP